MRPSALILAAAAALAVVAAPGAARGQRCDDAAPVALSRLWQPRPDLAGAGDAGVALRGWNEDRTVRPGRDQAPGTWLDAPWVLPEAGDGALAVTLVEALTAGPMISGGRDLTELRDDHPLTRPEELVGGDRRYANRLAGEAWAVVVPRCLRVWSEALVDHEAITALGAGREERRVRPRLSTNVTFEPSATLRLTLGARWDALEVRDAGLSAWELPSAGRDRTADELSAIATARYQPAPAVELGLAVDLTLERDDWRASGGLATPGHINLDSYQTWGNYPFTVRRRALRQRGDLHVAVARDGVVSARDIHTITAGLRVELDRRHDDETRNGGFTFADLLADGRSAVDEADRTSWRLYSSDRGDELHAATVGLDGALYVEDRIDVGSRLTITPGLRGEVFRGGFEHGATVWRTSGLAPRLAIDVIPDDGRTAIGVHAGRHFQRLDASLYRRAAAGAAYTPLEYWDWAGDPGAPPPTIDDAGWERRRRFVPVLGEPVDLAQPRIDRVVLALAHTRDRVAVRAGWQVRRWSNIAGIVDRRYERGEYVARAETIGPGERDQFDYLELPAGVAPDYAITTVADGHRLAQRVDLGLDLFPWRGVAIRLDGALAIDRGNLDSDGGLAEEWRDPSGRVNADGNMPGVSRVSARARFDSDLPGRLHLRVDVRSRSGEPYSRVLRVSPATAPRVYVFDRAGRGGYTLPWRHVVDVALDRPLPVPGPGRWELSLRAENLLDAATVTGVRETTSYFRAVRQVERPRELWLEVRYVL